MVSITNLMPLTCSVLRVMPCRPMMIMAMMTTTMITMTMTMIMMTTIMMMMPLRVTPSQPTQGDVRWRFDVERWLQTSAQILTITIKYKNYRLQRKSQKQRQVENEVTYFEGDWHSAYSPNCEIDVPSLQVAQMQGDIVELERRRTAEHREVLCTQCVLHMQES